MEKEPSKIDLLKVLEIVSKTIGFELSNKEYKKLLEEEGRLTENPMA